MIEYISVKDLYNVGGTCKTTRNLIRKNDNLWKDIVCKLHPSKLWTEIGLEDGDYLLIAINKEEISVRLQRLYVLYRLRQPINSPKGLGIYLEIITQNLPMPYGKTIIPGEVTVVEAEMMHLSFKRKDGSSFLVWRGEQDHYSKIGFYMIDRNNKKNGTKNYRVDECLVPARDFKTILNQEQKEEIGRLLKLDTITDEKDGEKNKNRKQEPKSELLLLLERIDGRKRDYRIDSYTERKFIINFTVLFKLLDD
jgi:hypothetical protein